LLNKREENSAAVQDTTTAVARDDLTSLRNVHEPSVKERGLSAKLYA